MRMMSFATSAAATAGWSAGAGDGRACFVDSAETPRSVRCCGVSVDAPEAGAADELPGVEEDGACSGAADADAGGAVGEGAGTYVPLLLEPE